MHHGAPYVFAAYCARKSSVGEEWKCDRRKRRSGNPKGFTIRPDIAVRSLQHRCGEGKSLRRLYGSRRRELPLYSEAGTMATPIELASTPEIWMVKGFGGISNFTLFRIPSQPLTPLDVTDRRNCPSCTTSIQPAADRLMVYLPGGSA